VSVNISTDGRINLIVPNKVLGQLSKVLYIIQKEYIYFLLKKEVYSLDLLEEQLYEKNVPYYEMVYILLYVNAYHYKCL